MTDRPSSNSESGKYSELASSELSDQSDELGQESVQVPAPSGFSIGASIATGQARGQKGSAGSGKGAARVAEVTRVGKLASVEHTKAECHRAQSKEPVNGKLDPKSRGEGKGRRYLP